MTDPLSDIQISSEILRMSQRLDYQVGEIAKRARAAAEAEVAYKLAHARAVLVVEGATVGEREARALVTATGEGG